MSEPGQEPAQPQTLAAKLDRLFRTVHPPNREEYTVAEVEAGTRDANGETTLSRAYIYQLRNGTKTNPTKKHLEALARFFDVDPGYFFDEALSERIAAQLELLAAMRDNDVRSIATRLSGLSPNALGAIRGMVEHARHLEGLPNGEGDGAGGATEATDQSP